MLLQCSECGDAELATVCQFDLNSASMGSSFLISSTISIDFDLFTSKIVLNPLPFLVIRLKAVCLVILLAFPNATALNPLSSHKKEIVRMRPCFVGFTRFSDSRHSRDTIGAPGIVCPASIASLVE